MDIPFSPAADRNKEAVGDALAKQLADATTVLEIGSGSGQHALYLCQRYSHLQWQVTEQNSRIEGLRAAIAQVAIEAATQAATQVANRAANQAATEAANKAGIENVKAPLELDVSSYDTDANADNSRTYSLVFASNIAHIMSIDEVKSTFRIVNHSLTNDGLFALYGPFKENGQHNSEGNVAFDETLQAEDPKMGIRDINELEDIAASNDLTLQSQIEMPSNNRILLWQRS